MRCICFNENHEMSLTEQYFYKPVGDRARAYTGDADAVIDYGLLIAT